MKTIESLFKKIQTLCSKIIKGDKSMFSITEEMMIMNVDYAGCQLMRGLEKLGFFSFRPEEQMCLLIVINNIYLHGCEPMDFKHFSDLNTTPKLSEGKNKLIERGLVRHCAYDSNTESRSTSKIERIMLSPDAFGELFYGMSDVISYDRLARQVEIIKPASIPERELFFEKENLPDIERLHKLLAPGCFYEVTQRLKERGRKSAISCLFYGAPGTGKTELAKQLARQTGRDILLADVSKLHSSFTGDTEKNYREMFNSYRYIQKILPRVPILLFNEADGILGKRGDVLRQAIDKIANRVQNILLQELEDFEGILIATTNLADNLDPAFERRLLYKIEFQKPGYDVRKRIWNAMIPELPEIDVKNLAQRYPFSGGQISNIASKRDIDYAIDGREPSFEQMLSYCECERIHSSESTKTIGFF